MSGKVHAEHIDGLLSRCVRGCGALVWSWEVAEHVCQRTRAVDYAKARLPVDIFALVLVLFVAVAGCDDGTAPEPAQVGGDAGADHVVMAKCQPITAICQQVIDGANRVGGDPLSTHADGTPWSTCDGLPCYRPQSGTDCYAIRYVDDPVTFSRTGEHEPCLVPEWQGVPAHVCFGHDISGTDFCR